VNALSARATATATATTAIQMATLKKKITSLHLLYIHQTLPKKRLKNEEK
jgi:hypothetical protein